jgi:peptidoglycan/LPS O-acetylase OafA/YrhL
MAVPDSGPLRYRPEIDGLRAVAVTGVLLYHAGFTVSGRPFLPGGFLGVDVFFVISGYLIARIILSEIGSTGAFSLARFYERRARRILPMLFLVILVVFPIGWRLLLPEAFAELARSAAAALLFVSNFFFYFATTEYGAESSLLKPLLHTWSLGIEEQFYVLFPLFALALHRFAPRGVLAGFLGVCLASFAAALYLDHRDPSLGFYSPLSRVWELLVGAMLAHAELRGTAPEAGRFARWTPAAALVVILASMLVAADEDGSPLIATVPPLPPCPRSFSSPAAATPSPRSSARGPSSPSGSSPIRSISGTSRSSPSRGSPAPSHPCPRRLSRSFWSSLSRRFPIGWSRNPSATAPRCRVASWSGARSPPFSS